KDYATFKIQLKLEGVKDESCKSDGGHTLRYSRAINVTLYAINQETIEIRDVLISTAVPSGV
ncbi:hypothetical protein J6590_102828, partial [Homalodisca vitripennis]